MSGLQQCAKMMAIYNLATSKQFMEIKQKHFSEFYTLFNSNNWTEQLWKHYQAVTNICTIAHLARVTCYKRKLQLSKRKPRVFSYLRLNNAVALCGKGKIRYVGVYTIAKTRYRLAVSLCNMLFTPGLDKEVKNVQNNLSI